MSPQRHRPAASAVPVGSRPTPPVRRSSGAIQTGGRLLGLGLVGLALVATACGDDAADTAGTADAAPAASTVVATPADPDLPDSSSADSGSTVTVRAVDFAFQDLPTSVPAGTRFVLDNTAATELHEMVAIPIPDDETRPIGQLVQEDLETLLGSAPPAFVLLAPPGDAQPIVAVGDSTLGTPGRYALVCMIPTGIEPGVYLEAAAQSNGGPPQVDGGPPHVAHGMFAEITVTG